MILAIPFLALMALRPQGPAFEVVHQAAQGDAIAFVHVMLERPQVTLGVYSKADLLAVWPPNSVALGPVHLAENERFALAPGFDALANVSIAYPCIDGTSLSTVGTLTKLFFPAGLPAAMPASGPILPEPDPPPEVPYPSVVTLGPGARAAVFQRARLHLDGRGTMTILRRQDPDDSTFTVAGTHDYAHGGSVAISADGNVILHQEASSLALLGVNGEVRGLREVPGDFFLSPEGTWVARVDGSTLHFDEIDGSGSFTGSPSTIMGDSRALEVRFLGDSALVCEATRVRLVDIRSRQVLWSRDAPAGRFASADLLSPAPGRILVALGWRDVLAVPQRSAIDETFRPGLANGRVEVIEVALDEVLSQTQIQMRDWDAHQPRVRLAGTPSRMLVVTSERALLSPILP